MNLSDLQIKPSYRSSRDNFVEDFFVPVLRCANRYDRAVGYFSSGSLFSLSRGIYEFSKNGGKIRLIASPYLTEEDFRAIDKGYKSRDDIVVEAAVRNLSDDIRFQSDNRLNFLSQLIEKGLLDIRLAFMESGRGLYHEKIGLISNDDSNEMLAFSGSLNETNQALRENYESIEVFCNWKGNSESLRVEDKRIEFENLWANKEKGLCVRRFERIEKEIVKRYFRKIDSIPNFDEKNFLPDGYPAIRVSLRTYQQEAVKVFLEHKGRGIFDMATGTGKTFTALGAIVELSKRLKFRLGVVIVVPFQHLVEQWAEEVKSFNIKPIVAYSQSDDKNWASHVSRAVSDLYQDIEDHTFFCILTTNSTFCTNKFQKNFWQHWMPENLLLVVDEAHNFGAEGKLSHLDERFKYRLALSATMNRHHDEEGTRSLREFFGETCISYDLGEAIKQHMLTPYDYKPIIVSMSEIERDEYLEISKRIASGRRVDTNGRTIFTSAAKKALIDRSNLIATISAKVPASLKALKSYCEESHGAGHILIYCGTSTQSAYGSNLPDSSMFSEKQIDEVVRKVSEGMKVSKFSADVGISERKSLIKLFAEGRIEALVAIKCLDEGVSINSTRAAFILASTTNPKEYIQRRGRVLRLAEGKEKAEIYDFITLPYTLEEAAQIENPKLAPFKTLLINEMRRLKEFKRLALNDYIAGLEYTRICEKFRLDLDEI